MMNLWSRKALQINNVASQQCIHVCINHVYNVIKIGDLFRCSLSFYFISYLFHAHNCFNSARKGPLHFYLRRHHIIISSESSIHYRIPVPFQSRLRYQLQVVIRS